MPLALVRAIAESIQPPGDAFLAPLRHGRLRIVLVVQRQVVEGVLAVDVHAFEPLLDDLGDLVRERRVVGMAGGVGGGQEKRVAVLMLEALAVQGGPPVGGPQQEAAGPLVARRPDQVADPLEAEHRVEGEERDHRLAVGRVRRPRCGERGHGAGLGDPLLEDLAVLGLHVGQ